VRGLVFAIPSSTSFTLLLITSFSTIHLDCLGGRGAIGDVGDIIHSVGWGSPGSLPEGMHGQMRGLGWEGVDGWAEWWHS
jgi:hypothetical protein